MLRRWAPAAALVAFGVALAAGRRDVTGLIVLAPFVVVAALISPRAFPRSLTDAAARASGRPIVYWRPGCPYCLRLRASLGSRSHRLSWVDIWADPAGAASVRAITGGDETVPTVVSGSESFVNPAPAVVRSLLRQ
jgi:mycoredoxin